MRERIDPPPSPSQSSRAGISRWTDLLDDPYNQKQPTVRNTHATNSSSKKEKEREKPSERKQSLQKTSAAGEALSHIESSDSDENVLFHNAAQTSHDEAQNDCYEDLTISTESTPDKEIQEYKEQLGRSSKASFKKQQEDESKEDSLLQFEKDIAGLDFKLSMATESDNSEEDLEMQPSQNSNHDPASYQKLVGPIDPVQRSNWKKSIYFLPCVIVLIVFIIVTPVVRENQKEESSAELVQSSRQPTIAPSSPSPSLNEAPTLFPSEISPSISLPAPISQSSLSPTAIDSATAPSRQCSAAKFPPSDGELDLIFLPSSFRFDYCTMRPEELPTFQRLNCFGTDYEYRPKGFVPNRFRESN